MKKSAALVATLLAAPLMAAAQPATYAIDPTHTFVDYAIDHFGTSTNRGRFAKSSGTVTFDRAGKAGKIDLTLDMTAIVTGLAAMDKHLQSADFFDSANHPTARFVADRFTFAGDKVTEVAGQLTMRGKTGPVTLKAVRFNCYDNPMFKREVCGGDFETTIQRSQWGVSWGLNMGFLDPVKLTIQVEAIKQ